MRKLREFLFRWRGGIVAPVALIYLAFAAPSTWSLMAGAVLAVLGEGIRFWSIGYTGEHTRAQELDAPVLVTTGPYSLVRNPLYLGNLLNGLAVVTAAVGLRSMPWALGMWLAGATFLLFVYSNIIVLEEEFLLERFGEDYGRYCEAVPALLPRRLPRTADGGSSSLGFSLERALRFERTTLMWQVLIWAILVWKVEALL